MDSKDRVWVSTRNDKGIFIFDPATQTTSIPIPYDSALQKEIDQRREKIYCDRDGIAWVAYWPATGHGINQLIPYSAAATRHSHENSYNITDRLTAWDVPINTKNLRGMIKEFSFFYRRSSWKESLAY
jgi:streptogramin lyase